MHKDDKHPRTGPTPEQIAIDAAKFKTVTFDPATNTVTFTKAGNGHGRTFDASTDNQARYFWLTQGGTLYRPQVTAALGSYFDGFGGYAQWAQGASDGSI